MCWVIPDPSAHLYITSQNVLPFQKNSDATGGKFTSHKNNDSWLLLAIKTTQYCQTQVVLLPRPLQALHCHLRPHLQNPNNLSWGPSQ